MSQTPTAFSLPLARRVVAATRRVERQRRKLGPDPGSPPNVRRGKPILARITGNASLATNRWKYAWTEVRLDGDDVVDVTNGRSGTTETDYAINLAEIQHTSTYAWGVDITADDYPDGFAPRPVGGGGADDTHKTDEVVEIHQRTDANGDRKYYFRAIGSHDGSCEE